MKTIFDLTHIGHDENILHDIATKDEYVKRKFPEASICEPYTAPEIAIPKFYPETRRFSVWGIISREFTSLINI